MLLLNDELVAESNYTIIHGQGKLVLLDKSLKGKTAAISYRVFPVSFSESYEHKKLTRIENENPNAVNPFLFEYKPELEDVFELNGLQKSGSISRGVSFGNNRDLAVNSNLNLQLSGKVSGDVSILASISDDNIPIQADGNTQQLQDFDKVFIQLFNDQWRLTAGDYFLDRPSSYFMNYNKKAKGGKFEITLNPSRNSTLTPSVSGAISKGKFTRNQFQGVEGNQGPYRLVGNENEAFIIVLSGTEKVYVDGKLLKRGSENDYVIDYNTAEITFTPNFLITKDKRIVVTFDYADRNYSRTVYQSAIGYESQKLKMNFNFFSEQDLRNQPLQQDLDDEHKLKLSEVGDSLQNAVVPNINTVEFSESKVLYAMIDTLGYDSVFIYSTNPDSAIYQLGFSQVGVGNGNYVQIQSSANGKVYQWVEPINGVPQGNYEPAILLISPKQQQMGTLGGEYVFSKKSNITWEGAFSNYDKNTFSSKNSDDDLGYALKVNSNNKISLQKDSVGWNAVLNTGYEYIDKNFVAIGPFRNIEFNRDWNTQNLVLSSNQHLATATVGFEKSKKASFLWQSDYLNNENEYEGLKNSLFFNYNKKGFNVNGFGSYLTTEGLQRTNFFRNLFRATQQVSWAVIGVEQEAEQNQFYINQSDSLTGASYDFFTWKAFLQNADTTKNKFLLSYRQRTDGAALIDKLTPIAKAEDIEAGFSWLKNKQHTLRTKVTYRKLSIVEPTLSTTKPDENVLGRIEYLAKLFKNTLTYNSFYQVGTGLEVKREFSYAEVQPGQGTHAYLGDLDSNGVHDLNEFEVAAFQDQANFIKIFTPTNDYFRTYTNDFNQSLFLNPIRAWNKVTGVKKFLARFSNRTNYRVARKVTDKDDYYNPLVTDISDSSLVTLNLGFLNTIYFNRTNTKWSADYTYQDNSDKSILTNGKEARRSFTRTFKLRWNIVRTVTFNATLANGVKSNQSEFFSTRNYYLTNYEAEPKLIYQPNVKFRFTLLYNYLQKLNSITYGADELIANKLGAEMRLNVASKGSFSMAVNYIENQFTDNSNNQNLIYEMLEGLQDGSNATWELTYQQNLSKHMQLSVNYNGRKSNNSKTIHIGGVQVRAFF